MSYAADRCACCLSPLVIREGRVIHACATWCRWAPRPRPPVVALPAREPRPGDYDYDLEEVTDARQ